MEKARNEIVKARYTKQINEYDYSELICTFEDGSEKTFHFCVYNPMPKINDIEGLTWEELWGMCLGMFKLDICDFVRVNQYQKEEDTIREKAKRYDEIAELITPMYSKCEEFTSSAGIVMNVDVETILKIFGYYGEFIIGKTPNGVKGRCFDYDNR